MYPLVKPDQCSTSTTDTLSQWKTAGSQTALTVSVVAVSLSAHVLPHVSVLAGTVVAVALLRPRTLVPAALGMLYGVLIAVGGVIYVPGKGEDPSDCQVGSEQGYVTLASMRSTTR